MWRPTVFTISMFLGVFSLIHCQHPTSKCFMSVTYEEVKGNLTTNITQITANVGDTFQLSALILYECPDGLLVTPLVSYTKVARILNCTGAPLVNDSHFSFPPTASGESSDVRLECILEARRLGGSQFYIEKDDDNLNETSSFNKHSDKLKLVVLRVEGAVDLIFRIVTILLTICITFFLGCGLDIHIIINYFKRPIAPMIGFLSQFCFMPVIAFSIAKLTGISPEFGLGLLTIGCAPGGGGSNVWTLLLKGDVNLSMTMTFMSTVLSIAMMPLWLYALGRFFIDTTTVRIPFEMIIVNVLQIVIPVIIGMLIRWKKSPLALRLTKLSKFFALGFILFTFTFGTYANLWMYELLGDYPILMPIGSCLPWCGFIVGFLTAYILRQGKKKAVTIALETGIQNIGIPILILLYSMPQPEGSMGGTMPVIVAIFTPMPLYILYTAITIRRKCCPKESGAKRFSQSEDDASKAKEISANDNPGYVQ